MSVSNANKPLPPEPEHLNEVSDSPTVMTSPDSLSPDSAGGWRSMRSSSPLRSRSRSPEPGRSMSPSSRTRERLLAPFKNSSRSRLGLEVDDADEDPLTEQDLREIFEEEEIQRFLKAFHSHVGEVTLPTSEDPFAQAGSSAPRRVVVVPPEDVKPIAEANALPPSAAVEPVPPSLAPEVAEIGPAKRSIGDDTSLSEYSEDEDDNDTDSEETWVNVGKEASAGSKVLEPEEALPSKQKHLHVRRIPPVWGSELAAAAVIPFLPQGLAIEARNRRGGKHDRFSLTNLQVAGQRAYLATYPFYVPLMLKLWDIARWIDWWKSARLCAIYWLLWWNNMLLPAFLLYIVVELIKHRLFPYPTLEQLEARRRAVRDAEQIGDAFISISSHTGPWKSSEAYSGFGSLSMGIAGATAAAQAHAEAMKVSSIMKMAVGAGKGALTGRFKKDKTVIDPETKMSIVEGDQMLQGAEARHAGDWRRFGVLLIEELADLHERAKNLFLWRKPESSLTYTVALFFGAIVVAVTPAQWLAKGTYAGLGFFYWFLIPTVCAMTRKQRAMLPPPLWDVPTDAEYAMEIIAQRLAQGQSVIPEKKGMKKLSEAYASRSAKDLVMGSKTRIGGGGSTSSISPVSPVSAGVAEPNGSPVVVPGPGETSEIHDAHPESATDGPFAPQQSLCFSAHHKHIPGIIRLSETALEFTPFHKQTATVHIDLDRIRGVKKVGKFRGLLIRYIEPAKPATESQEGGLQVVDNPQPVVVMVEKEDKFKWVGSRDEVFARIVASRRSWVPV